MKQEALDNGGDFNNDYLFENMFKMEHGNQESDVDHEDNGPMDESGRMHIKHFF